MSQAKKMMDIDAIVSVLIKYVHHSDLIRAKFPNPQSGDWLGGCLMTGKCTKYVCRKGQVAITFRNEDFEKELCAVQRDCRIEEGGLASDLFFSINETVEQLEVTDKAAEVPDETPNGIDKLIAMLATLLAGGEIDCNDAKLIHGGMS